MAGQLYGTSPANTTRTPTPQPGRQGSTGAAGPRRSSIVPFTRPSSGGSAHSDEPGQQGSLKSGEDAAQRMSQSLQQRRRTSVSSEPRSVGEAGASLSGLIRPERRPSLQFARGNGFVRKEGFLTDEGVGTVSEAQRTSPRPPVSPCGLLSRQLSSDTLQPPAREAAQDLKERLEKSYERSPPAIRDGEVDPAFVLRALQLSFPIFKTACVTRAFNISRAAHTCSSASLVHCGEVARTLADLNASEACVAAALLHSALDAGMLTEQALREAMPKDVSDTVCNVSKLASICQVHRELVAAQAGMSEALAQRFLAMLLAMQDVPAVLIVLSERLQQLRISASREAAEEALAVFAPLANRLGVWSIKAELEDLAFKALHPVEHRELQGKCEESQRRGTIEANLDQLKGRLAQRGIAGDLSGRPKNLWGVFSKMRAKGYGLDQVYDVRALRVVVGSKSDCYEVLREVHRLWAPLDGRLKDYIRHKKDNGYQSLHTVVLGADGVPMEVQIRTQKMHWIAEYGVAAHWRYKEAVKQEIADERQVAWCRWLISFQMELEDGKVRPSGSPPRDAGAAALSLAICAFPEHDAHCKFADYFRRQHMAPEPASPSGAQSRPLYVVVADGRASTCADAAPRVRIEQLPGGCTTGDLAKRLTAEGGGRAGEGHLRMLVNQVEVTSAQQALGQCDRVEVFESGWAEADPLHLGLGGADLERSRALLQRIFTRSGSLSSDVIMPFPSGDLGASYWSGQPVAN